MESNPVIELFFALGIILGVARVAGSLSRRLGQPRVFGELLAGVVLGPTVFNFFGWPIFEHPATIEAISQLAELGVLLLMFNVGLDVDLNELFQVGRVGLLGGGFGAVTPVLLSVPLMLAFNFSSEVALFTGVALAATSVSISAQTMLELGVLQTKEGYALLAMALFDDVLAILLVSFAVATTAGGGAQAGELFGILLRTVAYIGVAGLVAWFVLPRVLIGLERFEESNQAYGRTAFALIAALLFGWSAQALGGVAAITGSFIAGGGISRIDPSIKGRIQQSLMSLSYVFLMPIFFVNVGLHTDLKAILLTDSGQFTLAVVPFALLLMAVAVFSKVGGVYVGARLSNMSHLEGVRVGVCMISRGEVGLIIASIGLTTGIFSAEVFPSVFLVILASTVITPPLVRLVFRGYEAATVGERILQ